MKHLDDMPEPTLDELEDIEAWLTDEEDEEPAVGPRRSAMADQHTDSVNPADETDDERRARIHRNARDLTRIEHETTWAFLSRQGSFLPPKHLPGEKPPPPPPATKGPRS